MTSGPGRIANPQSRIFDSRANTLAIDVCCGNRVEWQHARPRRCVYADKLITVMPHVVHDFKALPFKDAVFDEVFFDPPHLIRSEAWTGALNRKYERFGKWETREQWEEALRAVNREFFRVMKRGGVLHVKIIDGKDRRVTKLADLDLLWLFERTHLRTRPSSVNWSSCTTINAIFTKP